jgi:hypothetical protein
MTDTAILHDVVKPEIGKLVSYLGGDVGIFLGLEGLEVPMLRLATVDREGRRDIFWIRNESLDGPVLGNIDDLARLYRGSMKFYDGAAKRNQRLDSEIEDMIQRARGRSYEIGSAAVQRIRDLDEPYNVDGISVCLDFMERTGANAKTIESQRATLAEARERRRVEMGFEPFCAATYFKKMHEFGGKPYVVVRDGGTCIGGSVIADDKIQRTMDWAFYEDPDHALRAKYARSVWEARPASDLPTEYQIIPLGG